jgi:LmbE family N-acetylglucosaminyl deacetylase
LKRLQPTEIYVTDEADGHIDHRAAFWFVREAAKQSEMESFVKSEEVFWTPLAHEQ